MKRRLLALPGGKCQACHSLQRAFCTVESQARKLKRAMELSGHGEQQVVDFVWTLGFLKNFFESLFCRTVEGD